MGKRKTKESPAKSPATLARERLAQDRSYFTVPEMLRLSLALAEAVADPAVSRQLYSDVTTYPYYDALAMWLDTPQWMLLPYFRDLCLALLEAERQPSKPAVLTDRIVAPRFRRYVRDRALPPSVTDMLVAKLSLLESAWLYESGVDADRAVLRARLLQVIGSMELRG